MPGHYHIPAPASATPHILISPPPCTRRLRLYGRATTSIVNSYRCSSSPNSARLPSISSSVLSPTTFIFDRRLEYHPRFLRHQVRQEIKSSLSAVPVINILTLPLFLAEVRGKSLLYSEVSDYGWPWLVISSILYMAFNDLAIYWIHRLEHHPSVYKYIHKPHHKWIGKSFT